MKTREIPLKPSLNKAYRLVKPKRQDIERFKANLLTLLSRIDEKESEENAKSHLHHFLRDTYYNPAHLTATKGRTDLVIHTGKDATSPAGVLLPALQPFGSRNKNY